MTGRSGSQAAAALAVASSGRPHGAKVTDNYVHDNRGVGLWADSNNVGFRFEGNYISGNDAEGIMYETSYNAVIVNNTFVRNALVKGPTNPRFPASAIYLSESGSDNRVDGPYNEALRVIGQCVHRQLVGRRGLGERGSIRRIPRQHQHRRRHAGEPIRRHRLCLCDEVEDQEAAVLRRLPVEDTERRGRGQRLRDRPIEDPWLQTLDGLRFQRTLFQLRHLSTLVAVHGEVVQKDITFKQNNVWRNNTYTGDWHFMVEEAGHVVTWDAWRSAPYDQDAGSSMN